MIVIQIQHVVHLKYNQELPQNSPLKSLHKITATRPSTVNKLLIQDGIQRNNVHSITGLHW